MSQSLQAPSKGYQIGREDAPRSMTVGRLVTTRLKWLLFSIAIVGTLAPVTLGQQPKGISSVTRKAIEPPLGVPPVHISFEKCPMEKVVFLGRRLFFNSALSGSGTLSCAGCHSPRFGFADDNPVSKGAGKSASTRNALSLLNVGYFDYFFWDGRASSLEEQVRGPIESAEEMNSTIPEVERRLNADPTYREEFAKVWGPGPITFDMVAKSIAAYERTLVSGNSPFDRWKYGHDESAVSSSVKRGFVVFTSKKKGNCAACHNVGKKYALFTDNKFHDVGVGVVNGEITDVGRYAVTHNETDRGKFKTPSLRNLALTAPYMHDGSLKDLKQVLDFYIGGGNSHPNLDKEIRPLDFLTGQERRDLLAFLNSLNGELPAN